MREPHCAIQSRRKTTRLRVELVMDRINPGYQVRGRVQQSYNGNAQTYMDVGLAMGKAMVELLKAIAQR